MELTIYISENCWGCDQARKLAGEMRRAFPSLTVELVDMNTLGDEKPAEVFASPTYLLNGRVISLGNPKPEALQAWIKAEWKKGE